MRQEDLLPISFGRWRRTSGTYLSKLGRCAGWRQIWALRETNTYIQPHPLQNISAIHALKSTNAGLSRCRQARRGCTDLSQLQKWV